MLVLRALAGGPPCPRLERVTQWAGFRACPLKMLRMTTQGEVFACSIIGDKPGDSHLGPRHHPAFRLWLLFSLLAAHRR